MTIGPLVNTIAQLSLVNSASASISDGIYLASDYKALVCLFLQGGCDMNNVVIPVGSNSQADAYAKERGPVAIRNGVVHPEFNPDGAMDALPITVNGAQEFGLNPNMPKLAKMFDPQTYGADQAEKDQPATASFVCNVGTLAEPTSQSTYSTSSLPKQLFSHSSQVTQWMSSISDKPFTSGWGARVAELYNDTWNSQSQTSMMISAGGKNKFMSGSSETPQYSVSTSGAVSLANFGNNYGSALDANGAYLNTPQGIRLKALEDIMRYSHGHIIEEGYTEVVRSARANEAIIGAAFAAEADLELDFDSIFAGHNADSGLADGLKGVARMIAGREQLGNNRQIFFVEMGGFDTHAEINESLPGLLESVDNAIAAFNDCLKALEAATKDTANEFTMNQVTTFQASDFNRTWTPNSSDFASAGTDHAWGSHAFVFGGAVRGGQLFGTFPELAVGGSDDVPSGSRGRWIPTTSVDQFSAVLANWFGVNETSPEMHAIFPNLYRFDSPFVGGSLDIFGTNS